MIRLALLVGEFVGRLAGWRRWRSARAPWAPGQVRRLVALWPGARGTIREVTSSDPDERARLAALGMTPGARVTVLQTFPAVVVQCDETEVALEPRVARHVLAELVQDEATAEDASSAVAQRTVSPCSLGEEESS